MNHEGKIPNTTENNAAAPIAKPAANGTLTAGAFSSSSWSHMLTMIRRYRNAATTAVTMAMIAMA